MLEQRDLFKRSVSVFQFSRTFGSVEFMPILLIAINLLLLNGVIRDNSSRKPCEIRHQWWKQAEA